MDYSFVTGRNTDCLVGTGKNEYLPKNAYDNYFYLATRDKEISVLEGKAKFEETIKNGNKLTSKIEVTEDNTLIELPYVYYPGYTVTIDGSSVPTFENKNGFLSIGLGKLEKSDLKVEYTGTNIMKFSKVFSIISSILFVGYIVIQKFDKKEASDSEKNV